MARSNCGGVLERRIIMIVEKPRCSYCNYKGYLKKTKDGWICPKCRCEYYDKPEPILTYWSYPYPLPEIPYNPSLFYPDFIPTFPHNWSTGDPLPKPNITISGIVE